MSVGKFVHRLGRIKGWVVVFVLMISKPCGNDVIAQAQDAASVFQTVVPYFDSCTQTYSPSVVRDPSDTYWHMWVGGWRNCAEKQAWGTDKIFHATSYDLQHWYFDSNPVISDWYMAFNDPTVVVVEYPQGKAFVMYMTGCAPSAGECFAPGGNQTYAATSWDGVTWSIPQLVVGLNNGYNMTGAWSPSALLVSNELIWLYFHDSNGQPLRVSINPIADAFSASPAVPVVVPNTRSWLVNLDVTRTVGGLYEMLFDFGDAAATERLQKIVSSDGLTFSDDPTWQELDGRTSSPPHRVITGHIVNVDATHYWLYFGWGQTQVEKPISTQAWFMTRPSPR